MSSYSKPQHHPGHRRVQSSNDRLLYSVRQSINSLYNDDQSICSYEIPHLKNSTSSGNEVDTYLADFYHRDDSSLLSTTNQSIQKRYVARNTPTSIEIGDINTDSKKLSGFPLKKSRSLLPKFVYRRKDKSETRQDDDDVRTKSLCSAKHSKSPWFNHEDDASMTSISNLSNVSVNNRPHEKKKSRLLGKVLKRSWMKRGKSDCSSDTIYKDDSSAKERRQNLISRLRNDRKNYLDGLGSSDPSVPLIVSTCDEEDESTQSGDSANVSNKVSRNCMTSIIGNQSSYEKKKTNNCLARVMKTPTNLDIVDDVGRNGCERLKDILKTPEKIERYVKDTRTKRENYASMESPSTFNYLKTNDCPDSIGSYENETADANDIFLFANIPEVLQTPPRKSIASSKSIASTPKFNVIQVDESANRFISSENDSLYADDNASVCSFSSMMSSSTTASSVYTNTSSSIRDPCAKQSRKIRNSKKLRQMRSDGDIWIEKIYVSKKTGNKRTYFVSVKTGERVRDEPPSGASQVLYIADLVHRKQDRDNSGPETIYLCNEKTNILSSK